MITFLDDYFDGRALAGDIDDWIDRWHDDRASGLQLHEYLGLTWPEFSEWVERRALPTPEHRAAVRGYVRLNGGELMWAHGAAVCVRPCAIHWPTQHHMLGWPQHWRADRGVIERYCPHGIGHVDPDDKDPFKDHGCDTCCSGAEAAAIVLDADAKTEVP